jgi:ADP-heptose:LPS heptosyltransferase
MRTAYLPIRSFGDFIITASVIKANYWTRVPVILTPYLVDIFEAISGHHLFEIVDTIDYDDQPAFFELYKVKDLKNLKRLATDVDRIWGFVNNQQHYLLDYRSRRLFFTGGHFHWPEPGMNIYEGKFNLLQEYGMVLQPHSQQDFIAPLKPGPGKRILILPDSRIKAKQIDTELISFLRNQLNDHDFQTARFSREQPEDDELYYSDFETLIQLIQSYDLLIGAESLPYHLAWFYRKPHFVIYNLSRHFNAHFMTPYMLRYQAYANFDHQNADEVAAALLRLLNGSL